MIRYLTWYIIMTLPLWGGLLAIGWQVYRLVRTIIRIREHDGRRSK